MVTSGDRLVRWKTLTEVIADQAQLHPDLLYVRFLKKGEVTSTYTYAQTWQWATRWAAQLIECGIRRGDAVFLALPNTDDFVGAYYGALLAGGVPVPVAPARRLGTDERYLSTVAHRLRFTGAKALVLPESQFGFGQPPLLAEIENLRIVTRADLPTDPQPLPISSRADDLGLIQFTSGTSGNARAVKLTHAALLAQMHAVATALELDNEDDWAVSWLPLYHDMGLIGYLLTPAIIAGHVSLLLTEEFMMSPSLWVKALSDLRGSITGGPPSAYALCARHVKPSEVGQYNLRRLRKALVGSEMVTPESLERFTERFGPAGFRAASLIPTYGMAENCLAIAMTPLERGPKYDTINLAAMQAEGVARPIGENNSLSSLKRSFTSVGVPLRYTEVAIADGAGGLGGERRVGEILVRSPSLMEGYYEQPIASAQILRDGWLWTGDLGYIAGGELYITGRKKEVIIVGGRNYHPDDLEQVASDVPGVRNGRVVVISYEDEARATEAVVVLAETSSARPGEREALRQALRQALVRAGYPVNDVVLLRPRTIPTTPNGKLTRAECKARYLAGDFSSEN